MSKISVFIVTLLFLFTGFYCAKNPPINRVNDPLPDSAPNNLVIQYSMNGGMLYYSESIYISSDSSFWQVNDEGNVSKVYFAISPDEMDKLYSAFKDNKFDRITTKDVMVTDRGGEDISLFWGNNQHVSVSNSGLKFIDEDWQNNWKNCRIALLEICIRESDKNKKNFEIRIDKSAYNRKVTIGNRNKTILQDSIFTSQNDFVPVRILLAPGANRLTLGSDNRYYGEFKVNPDSLSAVRIYARNDSLKTDYLRYKK